MRTFTKTLIGAGVALFLAANAHAQVFDFRSTVSPTFLTIGDGNIDLSGTALTTHQQGGNGGTGEVIANLVTTKDPSTTVAPIPAQPFSVTMTIDDTGNLGPGSPSHTFDFALGGEAGSIAGPGQLKAIIHETTPGQFPAVFTTALGSKYIVTLDQTPVTPGPKGGLIGAIHVNVAAIPEPSSMALLGTGLLPMVGLIRRRRK